MDSEQVYQINTKLCCLLYINCVSVKSAHVHGRILIEDITTHTHKVLKARVYITQNRGVSSCTSSPHKLATLTQLHTNT